MSLFFAGWFRRALAVLPQTRQRTGLHVEKLEPRPKLCASTQVGATVTSVVANPETDVQVLQDGNYIVVDGEPDFGSLQVEHQPEVNPHDDKIVIHWRSRGVAQSKTFALYKYVERGAERLAVKNVEFLEVSGGQGKHRYYNQTRLSSYCLDRAAVQQAREQVFGEALIW